LFASFEARLPGIRLLLTTFRRTLLEAATSASKPAWVEFERTDCGNRKRVRFPSPTSVPGFAAIELLLREGLGRPAQAEELPSLPHLPRTEAEARGLDWDQPRRW
jgi:hypothetical protein